MELKEIFGVLAVIFGLCGFVPYFYALKKRQIIPHVLSWFVWAVAQLTVFAVLVVKDGGASAWLWLATGLASVMVFVIALRRGDKNITRLDWVCTVLALASLVLWKITGDPLLSVILLFVTDFLAYIPSYRKAYYYPDTENASLFFMSMIADIFNLLAVEIYILTTVFYQAGLLVANLVLVSIIVFRRKLIKYAK